MSYKVPVYRCEGCEEIIGRVNYNNALDTWDGRNHSFRGKTGIHGGITKLKREIDGKRFVFIYGTQYQGDRDKAWLITDGEAKKLLIEAGRDDLLRKWGLDDGIDLEEDFEDQ